MNNIKENKRKKICVWCNKKYYDSTKRMVGKTCNKKCASALSVYKRHKNGSYKRTYEQNKKLSETLTKLRKEGKIKTTPEARQKSSKLLKEKWKSGEMVEKIKQTCLKKYGVEHYMKLKQYKDLISQKQKGKIVSPETLEKMSLASRNQVHRFSRCRGGYRKDLNKYFRSSWEANYARMLNYNNINWEYESKTFKLKLGKTYTPDFFLPDFNVFVELKG